MSPEVLTSALQPPNIRAVIVDSGEVLCCLPSSRDIERFARLFAMDPGEVLETLGFTVVPH